MAVYVDVRYREGVDSHEFTRQVLEVAKRFNFDGTNPLKPRQNGSANIRSRLYCFKDGYDAAKFQRSIFSRESVGGIESVAMIIFAQP